MVRIDGRDSIDRRGFFRGMAARLLDTFAGLLEPNPKQGNRRHVRLLRPPGAVPEAQFSSVCQRCGLCAKACPANAIEAIADGGGPHAGTPIVIPAEAPCVVCEGLQCTHVCPSGALLPLSFPSEIRMGIAEVDSDLCVRSRGESCTLCVDRCPLGAAAIRFAGEGPPEVLSPGCVGCGVCEFYCPTTPKAIQVLPR